jgi:hypothetical protein
MSCLYSSPELKALGIPLEIDDAMPKTTLTSIEAAMRLQSNSPSPDVVVNLRVQQARVPHPPAPPPANPSCRLPQQARFSCVSRQA